MNNLRISSRRPKSYMAGKRSTSLYKRVKSKKNADNDEEPQRIYSVYPPPFFNLLNLENPHGL